MQSPPSQAAPHGVEEANDSDETRRQPPPPHSPSQYEDVPLAVEPIVIVQQQPSPLHTWQSLKQLLNDGVAVSDMYRTNRILPRLLSYSSPYLRLAVKYLRERKQEELDYRKTRSTDRAPPTGPGKRHGKVSEEEKWEMKNKHDNEARAWKWLERSDEAMQEMLDAWVQLPLGNDEVLRRKLGRLMQEIVQIRNPRSK